MGQGLSNPTVVVNDVVISIIPNSISFKVGVGDKNVRALSAGGNSIDVVVTEDATTKKAMVKFKLSTTKAQLQLKRTIDSTESNTIGFVQGDITYSFINMVSITEPEVSVGVDSEFEYVFEGPPNIQ